MDAIKILVVEDEMIIGAKVSMQLTNLGYEVTGILSRGEDVLLHVKENKPDIVLLDINLKGEIDGIEVATQLQQESSLPIIYLTANADEATFNRAKPTKPYAFIPKPFNQIDLQRAIELAISWMSKDESDHTATDNTDKSAFIFNDRIFVRYKEKMIKIMLADILYVKADRNYSHLITKEKDYLLAITLKVIEEKLPEKRFLRIHRSFIANLAHIDEVSEGSVNIGSQTIPFGSGMRELLLKSMRRL